MNILHQRKTFCYFPTGFGKSTTCQSLPWLATRISRLVIDVQFEPEEMLRESCSQRVGKFHQNGIVLIISPLNAVMSDQIDKSEKPNMDAVKAEDLQRGIQETPRSPISGLTFA